MNKTNLPQVTCVMPTGDRPSFVKQAIRYFQNQDYPNKELLIVDDGNEPVSDLIPDENQIRYVRLDKKLKLGTKRNICVEESRSNLIMHWDDDDWYASNRISDQVNAMFQKNAEVCGLQQMLFYHWQTNRGWLYKYPNYGKTWLAGGSLLYTKDFWKQSPFPDIQRASDTKFIWSRNLNSYAVPGDYRFYVAMIHHENTSPKNTRNNLWNVFPVNKIKEIVNGDWDYYQEIQTKKRGIAKQRKQVVTIKRPPADNHTKVSACLLSWKRTNNMQLIVDGLHQFPFIDEILVWNNNNNIRLSLRGAKVRIINSPENELCYGRFLCAKQARNDIIYVQDDDMQVKNIPELYRNFKNNPSCITHALGPNHLRQHHKDNFEDAQMALLGWGAFFNKASITVFDDYLKTNAADFLFKREADIIFSLLLGKVHRALPANVDEMARNSSIGIALYRDKDHMLYHALAIRSALEHLRKNNYPEQPVSWNIVITCRNYGRFLEEAVCSVLQNRSDYVITILDDASTDNTEIISKRLSEKYPFINYIRKKNNKGVGAVRNTGIEAIESKYVILLDADDKIGPDYLYEAEKLFRKGCDVVNPDAILFGNINTRWAVPENVNLQMLLKKNFVHCAAAFRRELWEKAEGVDESMHNWQDYDFWIRVAKAGAVIKKIHGKHFFYRKHGHSKSSDSMKKRDMLVQQIRNRYQDLYD
jgi:glycosyltransferase involved in cell wall biosynthesis